MILNLKHIAVINLNFNNLTFENTFEDPNKLV